MTHRLCQIAVSAALLAACVPEGGERDTRDNPSHTGGTLTIGTTTPTGTPTRTESLDCQFEPAVLPVPAVEYPIATEEDFAFDGSGMLLYQSGSTLVGSGPGGGVQVLGTGAPGDPSGLAMRNEDELVIAAPDTGTLEVLDLGTGGIETIASGLGGPNGLTTDASGRIFVSERVAGAITLVDLDAGQVTLLAKGFDRPNGLALDESGALLFVADTDGIYVIEQEDARWLRVSGPKRIYEAKPGAVLNSVAVDLCGFVTAIDYNTGEVLRIDPDTGESLLLVDLVAGASFGFGALEYGNGGNWPRGMVFTSNRRVVTGLQLGIPGVTPVVAGAK